jgi:hypothetical protein
MMDFRKIALTELDFNTGQIPGLPPNPREWTDLELKRLAKSMKGTPELVEARGCIVVPYEGRYVVLGGNLRLAAAKFLKWPDIMCAVLPEGTKVAKLKEIVLKDNSSFGSWDLSMLRKDWSEFDFGDWGINVTWDTVGPTPDASVSETSQEEIERMRQEFEERMARGEISEEDEEYQEFLEKFKLKKTTDDCYTPAPVYDAVARYVEETYGISRDKFVRPFYPGGDYVNERYPEGCVVVDNPPFSIMAEILRFYDSKGIKFFLFAPTLTLFSSSSASTCTALPLALAVIYENGASVNTSFLTNLEPKGIRFRSAPKLYAMVQEGVDEFTRTLKKQLPKYSYPPHIITSSWVGILSRLGIEFSVPVAESEGISGLDSQKASGKAIYGKGYIVSDRVKAEREKAEREKAEREKAEREKAEREKAEREKAERWELSERELQIIERLNRQHHEKE